jgi:Glycosyl hydrolases family 18
MPRIKGPESDAIYAQYMTYYNDCAAKIHAIDSLSPSIWSQANVQKDRSFLSSILSNKTLYTIMQNDYDTTLDKYISDCSSIEDQIQAAYDDAMGGGNPAANQIQSDLMKAESDLKTIGSDLAFAGGVLNSSDTLSQTLDALQSQVDLLVPGVQKDKAQSDLDDAKASFASFTALLPAAKLGFSGLNQNYQALSVPGGPLDQLVALSKIPDPNADNASSADALLASIDAVLTQDQTFQTGPFAYLNSALKALQASIAKVQNDLNPNPTPHPGKVENACWYIDWTSWDFPVPQGVNVVNIFVGKLDIINGAPTASGFGNMDLAKLQSFVSQCSLNGIACKISLGGGGGSYDNCWDLLTDDNVELFAEGLAKFCHDNHLTGVDFDYEESSKDPSQCARVGTLIKEFKKQDSSLQTSLCTNASFAGWSGRVKSIMDATVDNGVTCLDRLYVMSYYDPMSSETGWLSQWASFLNTTYGMDASRLTVGIDNFDASAYNISDMASWAGSQGMSTGFWAYDPSQISKSNASTTQIKQAYDAASNIQFVKKLQRSPIKAATKIQKLVASLFKALHAIFVRFPRWVFNGFDSLKKIESDIPHKAMIVPLMHQTWMPEPSAPPAYDEPCAL